MIYLDGVSVPIIEQEYLGNFSPYDHQAVAEGLITEQDSFFAVNESPTGSGKTLSWLKPTIDERLNTIAIYPTNALIQDQVNATKRILGEHYPDTRIETIIASGETIASWRKNSTKGASKGEALKNKVNKSLNRNESTIIFTNPDIFTIVRKYMYKHQFVTNEFNRFDMVVIDEFHLSDVKQRDSLLFLVDELYQLPSQYSNTNRFYFLSATPEDDTTTNRSLHTRLREDVRVDVEKLTANAKPSSAVCGDEWRAVMPPVNLRLDSGQTFRTADILLDEKLKSEFAAFCAAEKTVVMLDGVHEVDQVYQFLSSVLDGTVHRITGFDRGDIETKLDSFDVLVSNSAVEVGLDFKPERIVFSAHNAPTLVQRLGRLRELDGRTLDAWCLVPESVCKKIKRDADGSSPGTRITRSQFERVLHECFAERCDLSSFSRRWGELEAYQHVHERANDVPSDQRMDVREDGVDRIKRHYYEPFNREFEEDDLVRLHKWTDHDLLEELKSYRGQGLQVMIWDRSADEMKLYDMFYILRWGDVEFISENRFKNSIPERHQSYYNSRSQYVVGFCVYNGKVPVSDSDEYSGRSVALRGESERLYQMKNVSDRQRKPAILDGIGVQVDSNEAPPVRGLDYLSDSMTESERLCYVLPGKPKANQTIYGLDEFMFLYPFDGDSIALGTTALYLHCLVQDRLESEERDWSW